MEMDLSGVPSELVPAAQTDRQTDSLFAEQGEQSPWNRLTNFRKSALAKEFHSCKDR